jgi:hypothetical protein
MHIDSSVGALEFFYKTEKIASFDSKTTHTLGLYRTHGKKEGFRYGPVCSLQFQLDSPPQHFHVAVNLTDLRCYNRICCCLGHGDVFHMFEHQSETRKPSVCTLVNLN